MSLATDERVPAAHFPSGDEYSKLLGRRRRRAAGVQVLLLLALALAVLALVTLLATIINDSFGLVAQVNASEPEEIVASLGYDPAATGLADLSKDQLVGVLAGGIERNVGRRLEREQRFYADRLVFESQEKWDEVCARGEPPVGCDSTPRDQANVLRLVEERIVKPDIIAAATLSESVFDPQGFPSRVEQRIVNHPDTLGDYTFDQVRFRWRAWFSWQFITSPASGTPEITGISTAILGTFWLMVITVLFAIPVGVGAALYLEEFAKPSRLNDLIQTNSNNLAGVPSIIYGMLGLAIFVRVFEPITSGSLFGDYAANGRTVFSAGLTLGVLSLPVVIISSQEAIRAVSNSLRHASLGLGATRWQTVRSHVLPAALPGILTGTILGMARAIGETAPLILDGAPTG